METHTFYNSIFSIYGANPPTLAKTGRPGRQENPLRKALLRLAIYGKAGSTTQGIPSWGAVYRSTWRIIPGLGSVVNWPMVIVGTSPKWGCGTPSKWPKFMAYK